MSMSIRAVSTTALAIAWFAAAAFAQEREAVLDLETVRGLPHTIEDGDRLWIADAAGRRHPITGVRDDQVLLEFSDGELLLAWDVVRHAVLPDLDDYRRRLGAATATPLRTAQLLFDPLRGVVLRSDGVCVDAGATWRTAAVAAPELLERWTAVQRAAMALAGKVRTSLPSPASLVVDDLLQSLAAPPGESEETEVSAFAREQVARWVRHGLLRPGLGQMADELQEAVRVAMQFVVTERATDGGSGVRETLRNGFDVEVHRLRDAGRQRLAVRAAVPQHAVLTYPFPADGWIVYDLRPDADPFGGGAWSEPIERAIFLECGATLATWASTTFTAVPAAWQQEVVVDPEAIEWNLLSGQLPPHLVLVDAWGDVFGLTTEHGLVRPPQSGSAAEVERFLGEAAKVLPTVEHLDLVGEYLVAYVPDSPDPERPWLPGTAEFTGDLHQTATATAATVLGGMCRGDCDDLAELYVELLRRQGRLAHVLMTPEHASALSVEVLDGPAYRATVLQSGPPMAFAGEELDAVVARVVESLDDREVLDSRFLAVLERFEGENVRQETYVDPRALVDREHAARLRSIDEAAQAGLYTRAVHLLDELGGPATPYALRRRAELLAGGCRFEAALAAQRQVRATARSRAQVFHATLAELGIVAWDDSLAPRAPELIADLLRQLPKLGEGVVRRMMATAGAAVSLVQVERFEPLPPLVDRIVADADGVLKELARRAAGGELGLLASLFASDLHGADPDLLGRLLDQQILVVCECVDSPVLAGWAGRAKALQVVERWGKEVALHDVVEPERRDLHLGLLGWLHMLRKGPEAMFAALAATTPPPRSERLLGPPRDEADLLRWVAVSRVFCGTEVYRLLMKDRPQVDLDDWSKAIRRLRAAAADATQRGADDQISPLFAMLDQIVDPLLRGDAAGLARGLQATLQRDDRTQTTALIELLARCARFVGAERWQHLVSAWGTVATRRNAWFPFAWLVLGEGAPAHAVALAEAAVTKFPGDPDMAAELAALREVAAARQPR